MATGSYTGTIKSFVQSSGWGFIECPETYAMYGKDIFVMKTSLQGKTATKGSEVTFDLSDGKSGLEAINVKFVNANIASAALNEERYSGVVKSFVEKTGWGLIECPQTYTLYGKDMFVLRTSLPHGNAAKGEKVSFCVSFGDKGPEAVKVKKMGGGGGPSFGPAGVLRLSNGKGGFKGAGGIPAWKAKNSPHVGYLKSFVEGKGWGFITDQTGKDIFVLKTAFQGPTPSPGDQVRFKVKMGAKGPEADEVYSTKSSAGQMYTGTVKSYVANTGWGFIASDVAQGMFGKDLFFHKRDLGEYVPSVGEIVAFTISQNQQGNPQAVNLNFFGSVQRGKGRSSPY